MRRIYIALTALIMLTAMLGCQAENHTVTAGQKSIVVTYSILGSIVKELVGNKANVIIIIPNGQDPHEWEPSAKDIEMINKANLVVQNGLDLEGGLQKTLGLAENNGVKFFTASDHITIRYVGPGEGIPSDDPDQTIGAADPHLWMDPLTMKAVVKALAVEIDKDFDIDLTSQAVNLESRLDSLNTQVTDILAAIPQSNRKLVTGHESMGYFAQRYHFKLVGVIIPSLTTQAEVSASDMATLKEAIQDNQVKAVFTELGTSPAVANAIGKETGVKVVQLTTHSLPPDGSYFTFMDNLAKVITNSLK